MILDALDRLAELIGPRRSVRSVTDEFGPTLGARYREALAHYSDLELIRRDRAELLAEIRAGQRSKADNR
jgi:hypothetical protein